MSPFRSSNDRRRRVLYATVQSDRGGSTAASRRETQRLREARRPQALYAERVQRRLQGRWFSLVPTQRRSFAIAGSIMASVTAVLVMLHYFSVTWTPLADAPEIARPLRLDRADSFGHRYLSFLLAASAGVALLIYQLRRYRIDDYRGQYRLWRTVLITLAIASVGVSVSLVDWAGSVLEAAFGRRVALSGTDWVRLLVSMGGCVLLLRLVAETHRCRFTLVALAVTLVGLIPPEAAGWNLLTIDSAAKWVAVTAGPLVGSTALFLGLAAYLRLLYREVCEIEAGPSLREQFGLLRSSLTRRHSDDTPAGQTDGQVVGRSKAERPKRGIDRTAKVTKPNASQKRSPKSDSPNEHHHEGHGEAGPAKPTRWWHWRKKRAAQHKDQNAGASNTKPSQSKPPEVREPETKPSPSPVTNPKGVTTDQDEKTESIADSDVKGASARERRLGLPRMGLPRMGLPRMGLPRIGLPRFRWFRFARFKKPGFLNRSKALAKGAKAESDDQPSENVRNSREAGSAADTAGHAAPQKVASSSSASPDSSGPTDQAPIDPDSIDWDKLSKAERRRLRKQVKRQNRAA